MSDGLARRPRLTDPIARLSSPAVEHTTSRPSTRQSISQIFADLRSAGRIGLMPFIPAGYPDLATTAAILPALEQAGASMIEIGFPFSDPVADGPTIQAAFTQALSRGLNVREIFKAISDVRPQLSIPLVAMVSYSIVFRYGQERFFHDLASAGFDGIIVPDLPPPEADEVCRKIRAAGLDTILLISPSTTPQRSRQIVELCSGFVYYLSVAGITGERDALPADLTANVTSLRQMSHTPVCVGFGISKPQHLAQLNGIADGAIVGSAFVRKITQALDQGAQEIARRLGDFCSELLGGLDR